MLNLLDESCSNKIRALQVITGIDSVIKELIENSLDAGATNIDIRLTEYGLENIEIIDNGKGILKSDLEKIGGRNFTSKIKAIEELANVKTYGYRGEALCCLICVSDITIISRHKSEPFGIKMIFDKNVNSFKKCEIAREIGTTVIISHLFDNIPIRKNELIKNIRKQFSKVEYLIESYGIISFNTKITYSNSFINCNSSSNNKKKILWSSKGGENLITNISEVFSDKVSSSLLKITQHPDNEELLNLTNINEVPRNGLSLTKIYGYISDIDGDNSNLANKNKAFIFINNHPCIYPKVVQIIKNIYLSMNPTLKTFIMVLLIEVPTEWTDVNAATDKKTIYVKYDKWLEELIRITISHTLNQSNRVKSVPTPCMPPTPSMNEFLDKLDSSFTNQKTRKASKQLSDLAFSIVEPPTTVLKRKESANIFNDENSKIDEVVHEGIHLPKPYGESKNKNKVADLPVSSSSPKQPRQPVIKEIISPIHKIPSPATMRDEKQLALSQRTYEELEFNCSLDGHVCDFEENTADASLLEEYGIDTIRVEQKVHLLTREDFKNMEVLGQFNLGFIITKLNKNLFIVDQHAADEKYNFEQLYKDITITTQKLMIPEIISLDFMDRQILLENQKYLEECGFSFTVNDESIELISSPCILEESCFGKDDIHQFLALKRMDYENNQAYSSYISGTIPSQLKKNKDKNYRIFNHEKLKNTLASKACRSSIMIGTSLSVFTMKQEIDRLSLLDQPWNCPHGRPTIRHLAKLS